MAPFLCMTEIEYYIFLIEDIIGKTIQKRNDLYIYIFNIISLLIILKYKYFISIFSVNNIFR